MGGQDIPYSVYCSSHGQSLCTVVPAGLVCIAGFLFEGGCLCWHARRSACRKLEQMEVRPDETSKNREAPGTFYQRFHGLQPRVSIRGDDEHRMH